MAHQQHISAEEYGQQNAAMTTHNTKVLRRASLAAAILMIASTGYDIALFATAIGSVSMMLWIPSLLGLAITLLIPVCGYFGARNGDTNLLCTSCVCSSICLAFSVLGVTGAAVFLVGGSSFFGNVYFSSSINAYYAVELIFGLCFAVLFTLSACSSWKLRQAAVTRVVIVHASPNQVVDVVVAKP